MVWLKDFKSVSGDSTVKDIREISFLPGCNNAVVALTDAGSLELINFKRLAIHLLVMVRLVSMLLLLLLLLLSSP